MTQSAITQPALSFQDFIENAPPGEPRRVTGLRKLGEQSTRKNVGSVFHVEFSDVRPRIDCPVCQGVRAYKKGEYFTPSPSSLVETTIKVSEFDRVQRGRPESMGHISLDFLCPECSEGWKTYHLLVQSEEGSYPGHQPEYSFKSKEWLAIKTGEFPSFGGKLPNALLRGLGKVDGQLMTKGKRCENQGLGVGAFAYYRQVVESQRDFLIDQIIKVAEHTNPELVADLGKAKRTFQFSDSIDVIKDLIPNAVYIKGENPFSVLHKALSRGLHGALNDQDCLELAVAIRLVLVHLFEQVRAVTSAEDKLTDALNKLKQ